MYLSLSSQFKLIVKYKTHYTLGWAWPPQTNTIIVFVLINNSLGEKYLFVMQIAEIAEIYGMRKVK